MNPSRKRRKTILTAQGSPYALSTTIKDTVRFPEAPGGRQYFNFTDYEKGLLKETSPALGGNSISCHHQVKAGYGPFTELYMILRESKLSGKENPENSNIRKGLIHNTPHILREKE